MDERMSLAGSNAHSRMIRSISCRRKNSWPMPFGSRGPAGKYRDAAAQPCNIEIRGSDNADNLAYPQVAKPRESRQPPRHDPAGASQPVVGVDATAVASGCDTRCGND